MMEIWNPTHYKHGEWLDDAGLTMPYDNNKRLTISVENEQYIFHFVYDQEMEFGNCIQSLRIIDHLHSDYLVLELGQAKKKYFGEGYESKSWYLYRATNSDFIRWYDSLPGPGTDMFPIEHHVIRTESTTYEILSRYEPKVIQETKV